MRLPCQFKWLIFFYFFKGKRWNISKILRPIEVKIRQPSCAGLPLDFSVDSVLFLRLNTTVKAEVQPRFFIPLPDQVTLSGKLNIRYGNKNTERYFDAELKKLF